MHRRRERPKSRAARLARAVLVAGGVALSVTGCRFWGGGNHLTEHVDNGHYQYAATQLSEPAIDTCADAVCVAPPLTIDCTPHDYWEMTLEEAIQTALAHSKVLRDLDGTILRSPTATRTVHDPAVTETDPRFGVESALSAFDASFATSAFFEQNDRALNNVFFGGGTRILEQDTFVIQSQIAKRAVTGTELSVRNEVNYDANNSPGNQFGGAYDFNPELVMRHPLLQGSGVHFNRIAGPSDTPGLYNGVVLARINTDVDLADFQIGVRNFVNDVENAYWDLYFAYRDLDARTRARDEALELWQTVHTWYETGRKGGDAASEAQAREQYYRFEEELQNALTGRLVEGTSTNGGSSGGTFRPNGGVLVAERRLRLLIGIPLADGRAIRPLDEPPAAEVRFEWCDAIAEALSRRIELRRQKWRVKRRELELTASRNFLKPELDVVGRYRWRGFGKDLVQQHDDSTFDAANGAGSSRFGDALGTLAGGDLQEWQLGFEFAVPFGFRRGHAAVRNAELQLARERTVLHEQEREVAHDLGDAIAELHRAHAVLTTTENRHQAARDQYESLKAVYEEGEEPLKKEQLYILLEAQRRWTDAEVAFHRAEVEYALAVKNVHFEKGSLLDYDQIVVEEGHWPVKAYRDAKEKLRLRSAPIAPRMMSRPRAISHGPAPQMMAGPGAVTTDGLPLVDDEHEPPVVPPAPAVEPLPTDEPPGPELDVPPPPAAGNVPTPLTTERRPPAGTIQRASAEQPVRRTTSLEGLAAIEAWIEEERHRTPGATIVPAVANEPAKPSRSLFDLPAESASRPSTVTPAVHADRDWELPAGNGPTNTSFPGSRSQAKSPAGTRVPGPIEPGPGEPSVSSTPTSPLEPIEIDPWEADAGDH